MDAYQWKSLDQYERTEALENRAHKIESRIESSWLSSFHDHVHAAPS